MRKVLYILGQLDDMDVDWMARHGRRRQVAAGDVLVRQGEASAHLFIVLDGRMEVTVKGIGPVASLGAGEIIGELSFVDSAPPSASVTAATAGAVLMLEKRLLARELETDTAFAMRFYRAIALFLADRLRSTVRRMGYGEGATLDENEVQGDELDEGLLDTVSLAGDRFDRLLKTLSQAV
jgi:CRP-like cAMP-binding protein